MTEQVHKLGEVLRAAREAKGVDLPRVERETKIRERYLSALERSEYRELPGSVYTKGFLRNYGAYLGLDPEYLIDLYRIETSTAGAGRPTMPAPPRPLAVRRTRTFVVTPGAVVAAILTVFVGAFLAYLGYQLVNFARMPELRITDPVGNVSGYTDLSITLRGITAPNATVSVDNLRENPTVTADADGDFEVTVSLVPGSNVVTLTAYDPVTDRDSDAEERTIVVVTDTAASPSARPVRLTLAEPAADATVTGSVPISGTAAPGATVTVTPTLVESAPATFSVTASSGAAVELGSGGEAPDPLSLTSDEAGAFGGSVALAPGTWELVIAINGGEALTRRVVVAPADGLVARLRIDGGESYVEIEEDGVPVADVSGGIASEGETIELDASGQLRIRAGNAGAVHVTVNGIRIGAMGAAGEVVEWHISRTGD